MSTVEEIIGRTDPNDFEAILAMTNTDPNEVIHSVEDNAECIYSWDYEKGARPQLAKLYEKAKVGQWNGETDLPWETEVDQEALAVEEYETNGSAGDVMDLSGTGVESWGRNEWVKFNMESQNWALSQFMHGEQGALVCTAKIVETVPWMDAKYYAATQVVDERHGKSSDKCVTRSGRVYYFNLWGVYSGYFLVNPNFASVSAKCGYEDRGATVTELFCFVSVDNNYVSQWKNLRRNFIERRWIEYNEG